MAEIVLRPNTHIMILKFARTSVLGLMAVLAITLTNCKKDEPVTDPTTSSETIVKKVLIEKISSTSCGYCPSAQYLIGQLQDSLGTRVINVSHYLFGPMMHAHSDYLMTQVNKPRSTPQAYINRFENGSGTEMYTTNNWENQVKTTLAEPATIGIAMSTAHDGKTAKVTLALKALDLTTQNDKLHVFLVEKVVVGSGSDYDQRNYGNDNPNDPYYGRGDYIEGFQHRNILRAVFTGNDGKAIEWRGDEATFELAKDFAFASGKTIEDYQIVAFVASGLVPNDGNIYNVQAVTLGEGISMYE